MLNVVEFECQSILFLKTSNVMFHIFGLFDLWRVGMSNVPLFGCQRYAGV